MSLKCLEQVGTNKQIFELEDFYVEAIPVLFFIVLYKWDPSRTTRRYIFVLDKIRICLFENVDVPVWHFEVNFRILVCQLVIYIYIYICICIMYMYYVYVLCICIMYMYYVYVLCILSFMYYVM